MSMIPVILILVFWFYVGRWLFRLALRNPEIGMTLLSGVRRLLGK